MLQKKVDQKPKPTHVLYVKPDLSAYNNKSLSGITWKLKKGNCDNSTLKNPQNGHTVTDPFEKAKILH